eukprot:8668335-Pyramimonas_sp.AAC.1
MAHMIKDIEAICPNFSIKPEAAAKAFKTAAADNDWGLSGAALAAFSEERGKMLRSMCRHLYNPARLFKHDPGKTPTWYKDLKAKQNNTDGEDQRGSKAKQNNTGDDKQDSKAKTDAPVLKRPSSATLPITVGWDPVTGLAFRRRGQS